MVSTNIRNVKNEKNKKTYRTDIAMIIVMYSTISEEN